MTGELSLRRAIPSFCAGKSLSLAALRQADPSSAGSDYSHELESVLRWRPPPQSCLRLQTSPPLCYLPVWGCVGWGAPLPRQGEPPPARLQACRCLSSSARLTLGIPGPWPSSRALSEKLPTPRNPPGGGSSPSPLTWNPDDPGFYVCGGFGKQNA